MELSQTVLLDKVMIKSLNVLKIENGMKTLVKVGNHIGTSSSTIFCYFNLPKDEGRSFVKGFSLFFLY